jgi:hypothetical protein
MSAPGEPTRYRVFGLRLASGIAFPELVADSDAGARVDLTLRLGAPYRARVSETAVMTSAQDDGTPWLTCFAARRHYRLEFAGSADFVLERSGRMVACRARRGTPRVTVRHLFLDQVMPLVLNLRGREALHASAVGVGDGVCVFVGESGRGKSTLAAAFGLRGFPVLADDCVVMRPRHDGVFVDAAYPGLRLWPESVEQLYGGLEGAHPMAHYSEKLRMPSPSGGQRARRLRAVYLLERSGSSPRGSLRIDALSLREAAMGLVRSAFRLDPTDRAMLRRQFETFEDVARRVPVRRLRTRDDLAAVEHVPGAVIADLDGIEGRKDVVSRRQE